MVLFGGLEVVVGGYFIHRYQKNKNEKRRLVEEAHQHRNNTFPGARPHTSYPAYHQPVQQQKYSCYAPQSPPQQRPHTAQPQTQPPPCPTQAQPYPHIQPLRRHDSFSSLSQIPVANGSQPQDLPPLPPRPNQTNISPTQYLRPPQNQVVPQGYAPVSYPYYNAGFSASYPSFEPTLTAPTTYTSNQQAGRHTVNGNWETYGPQSPHGRPQPGERDDDPPPPYRP
ncbi:hypothetical protein K469DRAFT_706948 [Zopfia rhizophila CBS 207.26]|uniref:Uncharacterized protein n=1 Tax=Zopfia rhizophila CBS 207.26 TaxID=1314779 RepID=A0A6A6E6S0_9PEZI|nr:hypothetical protein K469DRAFT_706948 [Zopfia rhizophila CBS 207.26]